MQQGSYLEQSTRAAERELLEHVRIPVNSRTESHVEEQQLLEDSVLHWRRMQSVGKVPNSRVNLRWLLTFPAEGPARVLDLPDSAVLDDQGRLKLKHYGMYAGIRIKNYACSKSDTQPHAIDFEDLSWQANTGLTKKSFHADTFVWLQCDGLPATEGEPLKCLIY